MKHHIGVAATAWEAPCQGHMSSMHEPLLQPSQGTGSKILWLLKCSQGEGLMSHSLSCALPAHGIAQREGPG